MQLEKLKLTNFKNYEFQELDLHSRLSFFVGNNGMGKTNLLDAIYYLCMGKSYFGLSDRYLSRHESDFFRLEALFKHDEKKEKIVVKVIPGKAKTIECNDIPYQKLSDHVGLAPVVIIAPDDTRIVTEGSEERRRLLDNTLSQLDEAYLRALIDYNKVLKQRNAALKKMHESHRFDPALLTVYDRQLVTPGERIFARRAAFATRFSAVLTEMYRHISGDQEVVTCRYRSHLTDRRFADLLLETREKDRLLQRSTAGIHRDDLVFDINGHSLKRFASQGQLKSLVLALKLAQYQLLKSEKKRLPILLLDDIFDKLDHQRVEQLLNLLINGDYGQIFITDTDPDRVSAIARKFAGNYQQFLIQTGKALIL